jgi:hypothetical protein
MSIHIKKVRLGVSFFLLAFSPFALAGQVEQDQLKSVQKSFFEGTAQVAQSQDSTVVEAQTSQYARFKESVQQSVAKLAGEADHEAQKVHHALKSLLVRLEKDEKELQADWGQLSLAVSSELGTVSHQLAQFGIEFEKNLKSIGLAVEDGAIVGTIKVEEGVYLVGLEVGKAAHLAAQVVEADLVASETAVYQFNSWLYTRLVEARDKSVSDWKFFAHSIADGAKRFGGEFQKFGNSISARLATGEVDTEQFFYALAHTLEGAGSSSYQGISQAFNHLESKVKSNFDATVHFFLSHSESHFEIPSVSIKTGLQLPAQQQEQSSQQEIQPNQEEPLPAAPPVAVQPAPAPQAATQEQSDISQQSDQDQS